MNYMSVVEDVRQVLQDFLAPELRAVAARFDAIDSRLTAIEKVMDARFAAQDSKFESLHKEIQQLGGSLDLERRLSRIEAKQASAA